MIVGGEAKSRMGGFGFERYKHVLAMVILQCIIAGLVIYSKAAISRGMSPTVFVVYRQAFGALFIAPFASFSSWRIPHRLPMGLKNFSLLFVAAFGATGNQIAFIEGLRVSSSTIAIAMTNLLPAATFVMALAIRLEKVEPKSLRSIAKIIGTVLSIMGGVCMALMKGPKLIHIQSSNKSIFMSSNLGAENLPLGCLYFFLSTLCWAFWKIMQVQISARCPDLSYSVLWTCIFSTIQSAILTLLMDHDLRAWHVTSLFEFGSCLYGGFSSALLFCIESWCISQRGPLFSAVFGPVSTVITAILATFWLHQSLYFGSLLGGVVAIGGLYVVLWGKAEDHLKIAQNDISCDVLPQCDQRQTPNPSSTIDLPQQ